MSLAYSQAKYEMAVSVANALKSGANTKEIGTKLGCSDSAVRRLAKRGESALYYRALRLRRPDDSPYGSWGMSPIEKYFSDSTVEKSNARAWCQYLKEPTNAHLVAKLRKIVDRRRELAMIAGERHKAAIDRLSDAEKLLAKVIAR